ncbi:phosphatidylinositol 3-kinase, putative [Bodo saltans]|uniref:Phosphatidylinositol 3-kinase, putative n=1 Tax=Bodo saltans TaxID=75058 RepID=A0A0S4J457_BODSA|nr:phosphatidylinositol 3-kinase, putative [Bodo saltans]|eukprot:CUG86049.1 phosphatidylinositol 3-kinase, putative [Bodo saltans]
MRKRSKIDAALQAVQHAAAQGSTATCVKYYTEAAKLWHLKEPARGIEFAEAVVRNGTVLPAEVTAKMILYATKWQNELVPQPEDDVVSGYRRALQLHDGAKGHLFLAQFYDGLYEPMAAASAAAPASMKLHATAKLTHSAEVLVTHAIRHYAKSLVHSAKVSSIALPRAMTLWLEHSALMFAEIGHIPPANRAKVDAGIQELNVLMESYFVAEAPGGHHQSHHNNQAKVSPILTMQALPQLISRLAHAHQGTTASIAKILLSLLSICPQQVLWGLLPVVRSIKQPRRATVAKQQVAQLFQRRGAEESRLVESVSTVFTAFLDICNASPDLFTDPRVRLSQMPFIRKVEKAIATSHCILPITPNISPNWSTLTTAPAGPTFSAFDDAVEVMSSLQKPKRMAVIGSDGVKYPFLCKAKDDPKKDIRMMEIVNRMNLLFQQDPESRKRRYRLRGYVVAALGDDYALIEWVSHQCALRRAVDDTYSVDGTGIRTATVRSLMAKIDGKTLTRMDMFKKHILVDAKPVFHQWFYHKFEDAAKWYQARQRYTVSCALWCAVGHIVGLGDRHGENMLIDTNTGEAMHVDFACMFDKGESLQEPERVRFRLTQNVVDALGVLGVDGGFRSTFETALRTQIQNKSEIMCVLETLLHDPLIEWGDRAKADPRQLFHRVRRRLEGYLDLNARSKEMDPVAQDASHQTSRLIEHATHWDNLSMMYIWWMAWV